MPPLTPGTNKKMIEVLKESFKSWEEAAQDRNITKGKYCFSLSHFITHSNMEHVENSVISMFVLKLECILFRRLKSVLIL